MNAGGWALMIVSVSVVVSLFSWCLYKVLSSPQSSEHLHSQADIEPPDARRDT